MRSRLAPIRARSGGTGGTCRTRLAISIKHYRGAKLKPTNIYRRAYSVFVVMERGGDAR